MFDVPTHLENYQRMAMRMMPCRKGEKVPAFKGWQRLATDDCDIHTRWFIEQHLNPAMPTGKANQMVVVDVDRPELVERFMDHFGELVRTIVRTPRGGAHFGFQWPGYRVPNAVKAQRGELEYDLRGDGGYVLVPPAEVKGRYRFARGYGFCDPDDLVMFPSELLPPDKVITPPAFVSRNVDRRSLRARSYIAKIFAVSGQNGHGSTFRAVCKLRDRGLTRAEAEAEMELWNATNAHPPWSPAELVHKIDSVFGT